MNVTILAGPVSKSPVMRETEDGRRVAVFEVTVSRRPTALAHPAPGDAVDVFTVVAFDKLAESVDRSASPGRVVFIEGKLRRNVWDPYDGYGEERSKIEVIASAVTYIGPRVQDPSAVKMESAHG